MAEFNKDCIEWQAIETIPKTGEKVFLLSENGKTDTGNWYESEYHDTDNIQDKLNSHLGLGKYTHWKSV